MTNSGLNWQDGINTQLLRRLIRPLAQPGTIEMSISQGIIERSDRFLNRLPLLSQQMQRWGNFSTESLESIPIVYAQPISQPTGENLVSPKSTINNLSTSGEMPLQAKTASSETTPQAATELSSTNQFTTQESVLPTVSSLPVTTNLSTEMPLQAKIASSETAPQAATELSSTNQFAAPESVLPAVSSLPVTTNLSTEMPVQAKIASSETSSQPATLSSTNQFTAQESALPTVSPLSVTTNLSTEMPLQAKMTSSETGSQPSGVELSPQPQLNSIDRIQPSNYPIVSPQVINNDLSPKGEMLLARDIGRDLDRQLPIVSSQPQNSSFSLPVVNPLNTAIFSKAENSTLKKSASSQQLEFDWQFPRANPPIVDGEVPELVTNLIDEQSHEAKINFENSVLPVVKNGEKITRSIPVVSPHVKSLSQTWKRDFERFTGSNQVIDFSLSKMLSFDSDELREEKSDRPFYSSQSLPIVTPIKSREFAQSSPLPLANQRSFTNQNIEPEKKAIAPPSSLPKIITSAAPPTETAISSLPTSAKVDIDAIAVQVERKLMRRLVIESERRGKTR